MNPPPVLDGARVLWWAWAGEVPFGELPGAQGDDRRVYGFAVCQYATGQLLGRQAATPSADPRPGREP